MTTYKLSNIDLKDVQKYLILKGAKKIRTNGGHEIWSHKDLNRSITLQTHITPVPEFILKQIISKFKDTKKDFHITLNPETKNKKKKETKRGKNSKKK